MYYNLLGRSAQEMIDQSLKVATKVAGDRLSGRSGQDGSGSKFGGSKGEVLYWKYISIIL